MNKFFKKNIARILALFLLFGMASSAEAQTVFKINQLISPIGSGVIMSNGVSTSTLTASTSPTVDSITATSTTATSTFPNLSITGAVSILGEYFTNFTTYVRSLFTQGTGITISSGQISATLGTNIDTSEIVDGTIIEPDLNADNTPSDRDILTYDSTGTNFNWESGASLCIAITGSADLCDGNDAAGGGGGDSVWSRNSTTGGIYTPTTTDSVIIGRTATTTNSKLEVDGLITGAYFNATSSIATSTLAGFLTIGGTDDEDNVILNVIGGRYRFGPVSYPGNYVPSCADCAYLMIDKSASADDASVVFRDQGDARAEIGLVGDNDLRIKTISGSYGSESFSTRIRIMGTGSDEPGNVGIGQGETTVPSDLLSVGTDNAFTIDYVGNVTASSTITINNTTGNGVLSVLGHQQNGGGAYIRVRDDVLGTIGYFGQNSAINGGTAYNQFSIQNPQGDGTLCFSSGARASATAGLGCDLFLAADGIFSVTGTSTLATTTSPSLELTNLLTFDGVTGDEWSDFCTALTGSASLCDGNDAEGSGTGNVGTSTTPTIGNLAYWTTSGASPELLGTVATGTLATDATGLEFNASRAVVGGSATLSLSSGYIIPLSASTTNWNTFYDTPSNRITAGTGLSWSTNTLNCSSAGLSGTGCVNTTSQSFAGAKTFTSAITTLGVNGVGGSTLAIAGVGIGGNAGPITITGAANSSSAGGNVTISGSSAAASTNQGGIVRLNGGSGGSSSGRGGDILLIPGNAGTSGGTTGKVGIGTTTPWALLSVHANDGQIYPMLFDIASSTASATTSLFSVDAQGNASTTRLFGSNLSSCTGGNKLTWDAGLFGCGTDATGSGDGLATSTDIADTQIIYGTSASTVGSEAAFTYDDSTNTMTVGQITLGGDTIDEFVGDGLDISSGDLIFDCSDVAGTGLSCSGEDLVVNLSEGFAIDISGATITFDPTEITGGTTFDDGGEASVTWTWNISAGDPQITFGNDLISIADSLTLGTGKNFTIGSTQWNTGDSIDGEQIANGTIDDDALDFTDITIADFTGISGNGVIVNGNALDFDCSDVTDSGADDGISCSTEDLVVTLGATIGAGEIEAAAIDGDDINGNIAGRSLTLTSASPDTLDIDAEIYTDTKCIWFEDPTADDDFKSIWKNHSAGDYTLTKIWGESDQTVNFDLQVDDGSPADVNGTDISPAGGEAEDTSLGGDTTLAAGEELDLAITSVSGSPTYVSICWTYTKND